jgi:uridylate kinase
MGYVVKFGGSLLFHENLQIKQNTLREIATILLSSKYIRGVVCGGGRIARVYIHAGRELGLSEDILDTLGIQVSRINAQLLIYLLGKIAFPRPIISLHDLSRVSDKNKIVVAGGFVPKQSTTTVAMQISEKLHTDLIILTDVDGIYTKDPKKYPDAKKFDVIHYSELESLLLSRKGQEQTAGKYQIFDLLSFRILKRSGIRIRFINGSDLTNLQKALNSDFNNSELGTIIIP